MGSLLSTQVNKLQRTLRCQKRLTKVNALSCDEIGTFEGSETKAPETKAPETKAPETKTPKTKAPETKAPETKAPETKALETKAPETKAPETKAPETKAPEIKAPETKAPKTKTPKTKTPKTKAPETKAPETKAPETKAPETKAPKTRAVYEEKKVPVSREFAMERLMSAELYPGKYWDEDLQMFVRVFRKGDLEMTPGSLMQKILPDVSNNVILVARKLEYRLPPWTDSMCQMHKSVKATRVIVDHRKKTILNCCTRCADAIFMMN
jgi:hypothetical protein